MAHQYPAFLACFATQHHAAASAKRSPFLIGVGAVLVLVACSADDNGAGTPTSTTSAAATTGGTAGSATTGGTAGATSATSTAGSGVTTVGSGGTGGSLGSTSAGGTAGTTTGGGNGGASGGTAGSGGSAGVGTGGTAGSGGAKSDGGTTEGGSGACVTAPGKGGAPNMLLAIDMSGYSGTTAEFGPYTNGFSDNNDPAGVFVMNIPAMGWLHLSWSYTGNHGTFSFTVDGKEYPTKNTGGQPTMAFGGGVVTLGASQSFGFPGWAGVMDEVRVWKVARTPQQILDNMRVVLKPTEPGLAAYYRFNEGSGSFSDDESMTMSHRVSTCTALSGRCIATNNASPTWVASDIPGTFTCAP